MIAAHETLLRLMAYEEMTCCYSKLKCAQLHFSSTTELEAAAPAAAWLLKVGLPCIHAVVAQALHNIAVGSDWWQSSPRAPLSRCDGSVK
jgi:hypothetical protein